MNIGEIIEDCLKSGNTKGNGQAWEVLDWESAKTIVRSAIIKAFQHRVQRIAFGAWLFGWFTGFIAAIGLVYFFIGVR